MAVLWDLGPSAPAKAFTTLRVRVRINQKCIFFYIFGSSQGYEATTKEGKLPKFFLFAKVTLKKSMLEIPENDEEYLNKKGINLYPTKIEYLNENFEVISKIEFNKFGIAKFEGFENYREG